MTPEPDNYFWYAFATGLASILIVIIWRYVSKTERVLEKITDSVNGLIKMTAVNDLRIGEAEKDIKELKQKTDK